MVKSLFFKNLSGQWTRHLDFYPDINVLTGRNGAGKTTILKLLWYLVSGNIERIVPEIRFDEVVLILENLELRIAVKSWDTIPVASVRYDSGKGEQTFNLSYKDVGVERDRFIPLDEAIAKESGRSVFFPTFRRIEGGFTIGNRQQPARSRRTGLLQTAMVELSEELSFEDHWFVSSISTDDIESLLTRQYAVSSDRSNALQNALSERIEQVIQGFDETDAVSVTDSLTDARNLLKSIQGKVQETREQRERLFQPFTTLENLLAELLEHKGIDFRGIKTFGDVAAAVDASYLSAGEKQMLSFLCYNAFMREAMIFIDEPETSLHVDWQRVLFPKLLEQSSDNQFFVATHSPFIYSKFADKELIINPDSGDTHA